MRDKRKYLFGQKAAVRCMIFCLLTSVLFGCGQIENSSEPHSSVQNTQEQAAGKTPGDVSAVPAIGSSGASSGADSQQDSSAPDSGGSGASSGADSQQGSSAPDISGSGASSGADSQQGSSAPDISGSGAGSGADSQQGSSAPDSGGSGASSGADSQQGSSAPDSGGSGASSGADSQQGSSAPDSGGGNPEITPAQVPSTPASGALSVNGARLVNASGNPVQLRGISTHGLAWYPDYVNEACFRQVKEEWGADVIRLAMYTAEYGGYCSGGDKDSLKNLIRNGVDYATDCGLYVIIDWHILSDGNPNTYIEDAVSFFAEMSKEYADYTNVFYEICNEPNGGTSWADIKLYAEQVIAAIRENDTDGIILVGTPNWSQYVDQAAADPIEGYENIMYTLHFYAATHTDSLRDTMVKAVDAGLPVFVSEYGICDASGNGAIDTDQANEWVRLLDQYQISYVAWNLSNKSETSALLKGSCNKVSGFTKEDLSDSGQWLYDMLRRRSDTNADESHNNPGGNITANNNTDNGSFENNHDIPDDSPAQTGNDPANKNTDIDQESGSLAIDARIINSWQQGDDTYYQYSVTLTNNTGEELTDWRISLSFSGEITLSGSWNGTYQAEDHTLTISSMDYNGYISQGESINDIGFILYGTDDLTILDAVGN